VSVGVIVEPLVMWLWVGGLVLALGAALSLWPKRGLEHFDITRAERAASSQAAGGAGPSLVGTEAPVGAGVGPGPVL
jgi:hypothetical protein